jgi:hypothetical protein
MLAGLYPMTFVLQRFNIRSVLGPVVLLWAVVCAATAGVTTWKGLFVQRFFLGMSLRSEYKVYHTNIAQDSLKVLSQLVS